MAMSDYLCFEAASAGSTVGLAIEGTPAYSWRGSYSIDGENWNTYTIGTTGDIVLTNIGDKVWFKGLKGSQSEFSYHKFVMTGLIKASGNVMSLMYQTDFATRTVIDNYTYVFNRLFSSCTSLITPPELPATTLAYGCYSYMFVGCTNLVTTPELPATTLASNCYSGMFYGCTKLKFAPTLPATELAVSCYASMFQYCTSLIKTPELPAMTLAASCCYSMFQNCTSLTTIPLLPATNLSNYCYARMFRNCVGIKVSESETSEYSISYRIPSSGTGVVGDQSLWGMFDYTGGTFTDVPTVNATYYLAPEAITSGLCFTANQDNSSVTLNKVGSPSVANTQYSLEGRYWNDYTFGTAINLNEGEKVYFRNDITGNFNTSYYLKFAMTGSIGASGNINSMHSASNFENLTTLSYNYCYYRMFYGCTSLTTTPELPATTLTNYCYYEMFNGCTSLTTVPTLPATTLTGYCYMGMFTGCTSLTIIPELPATTLTYYCYYSMFSGCIGIKLSTIETSEYSIPYRIPSSETGTTAYNALTNMFASTGGTFTGTPTINTTYYLSQGVQPITTGLCFEAVGASSVTLKKIGDPPISDTQYSTDGLEWISYTIGTQLDLNDGDKVYFRNNITGNFSYLDNYLQFSMRGSIKASGNVNSMYSVDDFDEITTLEYQRCYERLFSNCSALLTVPELPATTLSTNCYEYMFSNCTNLTTPPELPATTLGEYCYEYMFYNCTSLTTAPELPATNVMAGCYWGMFSYCTSLTVAPELPATNLANVGYCCYQEMFKGCRSLLAVPELPATAIWSGSYFGMFEGCTSLTTLPILPITNLPNNCYQNMFKGCTGIKISETQTEEYGIPYRIPSSGTGSMWFNNSLTDMFVNTGGTFTGTPSINTTYYLYGQLPTTEFDRVELSNSVLNHLNISSSITFDYSTIIPETWTSDTIIDANFNNNLSGDKIKLNLSDATSIRIKRRENGTFNWVTLFDVKIENQNDLNFILRDCLNRSKIKYEYALVPVMQNEELGYIIASVDSVFDGIFICDSEDTFKMFANVTFGTSESSQTVGISEPIGRKYPFVINNSQANYMVGSVNGMIMNSDYEDTRNINVHDIVKREKVINAFLKNKRAKVLKDFNGNIWIVMISGNPSTNYVANYGNGLIELGFSWIEQGDPESQLDLYNNGLIDVSLT